MATCTLTLYTGCKLGPEKNFIVDNLSTYLGTLESTTITDFQYQRFELNKTIKVNLDQLWQTKINNIPYEQTSVPKKWNYCTISTKKDNTTINYYYFIIGYKQIAQKTVELDLVMDSLNTFNFSDTPGNYTYTLSPKTIVTREHKNRLAALPVLFNNRTATLYEQWAFNQLDSNNYYQNTSSSTLNLLLNINGLKDFMTSNSLTYLELTCATSNGTYIQFKDRVFDNILQLWVDTTDNIITIYDSQYQTSIPMAEIVNNFVIVIPVGGDISFDFDSYVGDWSAFINSAVYKTISVDIIKNRYKRLIDPYQEGIATTLFKTAEETLYDNDEARHWMLTYRNDEDTSTTVNTLLYPEYDMTVSSQSAIEVVVRPGQIKNKVSQGEYLKFMFNGDYEAGNYIEVNGTRYEVVDLNTAVTATKAHAIYAYKQNAEDTTFKYIYKVEVTSGHQYHDTIVASNVSEIKVKGWGNAKIYVSPYTDKPESGSYWMDFWVGSKSSITNGTIKSWKDVVLSDTKLIKAFVFPYCPSQFLAGKLEVEAIPNVYKYASAEHAFQLLSTNNNDFSYEINFNGATNPQSVTILQVEDTDIHTGALRNDKYESKLYHSDYYQPKFIYDSFSYAFNLENLDIDSWLEAFPDYTNFSVNYTVSTNIVSKFAFQFLQYATKRATQDYEGVLTIERNNEKALYNNDYLNYIKNGGYSYDQKKATSQNAVNGITTALSIIGATASFASSSVTGPAGVAAGVSLATAAAGGIARGIYTAQEQDKAIAQKMLQAQMQGTTVQGCEDLDILTVLTGNKAKLAVYKLSNVMSEAMADLFHYCGYATYEQKVPTHDSRTYFNYIQADIVYDEYTFNEEIAEDIKAKWASGVTFLHRVGTAWDFDQKYENWETSLI